MTAAFEAELPAGSTERLLLRHAASDGVARAASGQADRAPRSRTHRRETAIGGWVCGLRFQADCQFGPTGSVGGHSQLSPLTLGLDLCPWGCR